MARRGPDPIGQICRCGVAFAAERSRRGFFLRNDSSIFRCYTRPVGPLLWPPVYDTDSQDLPRPTTAGLFIGRQR
jgi:hypothetical protein